MVSMPEFLTAGGTYGGREQVERLNGAIWRSLGDGWVEPRSDEAKASLRLLKSNTTDSRMLTLYSPSRRKVRALCAERLRSVGADELGL